jgi:hypothetical protein
MNYFMLGLPILFFLSACGQPTTTELPREKIYRTTYSNSPIFLKVQKSRCRLSHFNNNEVYFDLHLFQQGTEAKVGHNFSPILQGLFLKDKNVISQSFYGEEVELLYSLQGIKNFQRASPKPISVCPEVSEYYPGTVESAALNSSYFIHKSNLRFTSVIRDISVAPVILNISPSILKTVITDFYGEEIKQGSYMTDNAFYMPANGSVTFLPHSLDMRKRGMNTSFWEVPMVASHEYGHHLFQMIFKQELDQRPSNHSCFGTNKSPKIQSFNKNKAQRQVKIQDVINAYNEGFADLIAFYTLDPEERGTTGVKCLEVTRDVSSPRLINGKAKKFSKDALRSFFSFFEDRSSTCENPSFQEVHVLGAVFAHNVDSFLSLLTDSEDEKLDALVDWVKFLRLEKKKYHLASAETYLEKTFSDFLRISLIKFNKTFDDDICKNIARIYPDLNIKECGLQKDL